MSTICSSAKPVNLPSNVTAELDGSTIKISGPLGQLDQKINLDMVAIEAELKILRLHAISDSQYAKSLLGALRALILNMIKGVSSGFEKKLTLVGVGYRAQLVGRSINLNLGLSHPVIYELPEGIEAIVPTATEILIRGIDKQKVGQVSAEIRFLRKPEPYKGKGIRYSDELILLKENKKK